MGMTTCYKVEGIVHVIQCTVTLQLITGANHDYILYNSEWQVGQVRVQFGFHLLACV